MAYLSKRFLDRYLGGDYRPRRVLRFVLQDALVAAALRFQSTFGLATIQPRWLPQKLSTRWRRLVAGHDVRGARRRHNGHRFRAPDDLQVSDRPIRRVVLIGTCLAHEWQYVFQTQGIRSDFVLSNFAARLPDDPPTPLSEYDFQIIQLALESVLPDLSLARLAYDDLPAHQALLEHSRQAVSQVLAQTLRWNIEHGLLTFVANFLVPQQNPSGRLMPRHDLRNPMYFVEQLNACLSEELKHYPNAHLLDIDQIAGSLGKKNLHNDTVLTLNHAGILNDYELDFDQGRIEPQLPLTEHYAVRRDDFILAIWAELVAMYRTLGSIDPVKLVVVDLDDTLWRGVIAEERQISYLTTYGWPRGLMEALCFLKKRGVLLAIISKNDERTITGLWDGITDRVIRLEDFAARRINWRPKAENLQEILTEVNVLPRNVLFIDDNPVERAAIKASFPDVRVLDGHQYYWRRILLWAAETQVPVITDESVRRTEMVQAQIERETWRRRVPREEFLASLAVKVRLREITSTDHPLFPRVLELINKTNQFNTTGKRWSQEECGAAFAKGRIFFAFEVDDRFSFYGVVGVALVHQRRIEQFVMSCRVLGLDAEVAAIAEITRRIRRNDEGDVIGELVETDANSPCRDLFNRCGFEQNQGCWIQRGGIAPVRPEHAAVS